MYQIVFIGLSALSALDRVQHMSILDRAYCHNRFPFSDIIYLIDVVCL